MNHTQDANCEKIENAPLNHIVPLLHPFHFQQNHIDEMEATTLASIISPYPLSVEELATSESVSADDAVSGPVQSFPSISHAGER